MWLNDRRSRILRNVGRSLQTGFRLAVVLSMGSQTYAEKSESAASDGNYDAYLDLSYALDSTFPDNDRWRIWSTATHVSELAPNTVRVSVQKKVTERSRWNLEFGLQDGR